MLGRRRVERPPGRLRPRRRIVLGAIGAGVLLLLGAVGGGAVLLSGALSTAATVQHSRLTHWILDTGLRYSVHAYSKDLRVPPLDDALATGKGLACYREHCAECHGAPGVAPGAKALGMMPVPDNLVQTSRDWDPAWLYYVMSKGIRMTGMPAWEFRLPEPDRWATVAFLKRLPGLDAAAYGRLSAGTGALACPTGTSDPRLALDGKVLLRQYGCHSCHRIEGVVGPDADVGPPLAHWPQRAFIAGKLPNNPENLARWIAHPHDVDPKALMPDLGVPAGHARAMARFLFEER